MGKKTGNIMLIVGDPLSGFAYFGPFHDFDTAQSWGDRCHGKDVFWVAALCDPSEYEDELMERGHLAPAEERSTT